jgi:hypothetical protein
MKKYKGIYYLIKQNPHMYSWLAYIKLPDKHKWVKKNYDDIPLDCHGGLTFKATVTGKENHWQGFTKGTWIGWDYGHVGDFTDYGFAFSNDSVFKYNEMDKKWEYEEVEKEVKEVIEKII